MRNFSSSMHGNIDSAQNRAEKRAELERELGHEKNLPKPKMTGLIYHDKGKKTDKRGKAYTPHYGSKSHGQEAASFMKGRYVHLGEDVVDISFEDMVEEACWKGYKQVGMKKKGDKQVPNCVPEETVAEELTLDDYSIEELEEYVASEEFEQLDELSKSTLTSYISKSSPRVSSLGDNAIKLRKKADEHSQRANSSTTNWEKAMHNKNADRYKEHSRNAFKKQQDRVDGIKRATSRLARKSKELDESIVHSQEDVTGTKYHVKKLSSGSYDLHKQAKSGEWSKLSSHKSLESAKQSIK